MASQAQPSQVHSTRKPKESEHHVEAEIKNRGSDILGETLQEFKERGDDVRTLVTEYVREKPFKSLGIALLTGVALAVFMRR